MELKTITEFDFGVGGNFASVRVSQTPSDVTKLDVKFILWLMIEQEFRCKPPAQVNQIGYGLPGIGRTERDGVDRGAAGDGPSQPKRQSSSQKGGGLPRSSSSSAFLAKLDPTLKKLAREYAEDSLREAGIRAGCSLLEELSQEDRSTMLMQLCKGSELLSTDSGSIRTVPQIFRALRSPSKFVNKFEVVRMLAEGQFGKVYQVKLKSDPKKEFAVKKISVTFESLQDDVQMALNESNHLKALRGHKNIVELYDSWLELRQVDDVDNCVGAHSETFGALKFYIQLELCGETLLDWKNAIYEKDGHAVIDEKLILQIAKDIFDGLSYIHKHNILHLDIKSSNIVWANSNNTHLKIVDFGLAVSGPRCEKEGKDRPGTPGYLAPEPVLTAKSDIYSAAVTIAEVTVFTNTELMELLKNKASDIHIPVLKELLPICLNESPEARPSSEEIRNRLHLTI